MYGKSYESQYEGSMVGAGLNVFAVWGYVITKVRDGYVELNPRLLAFKLGGTVKEIEAALDYLQQPDPDSRSKSEGGRRLVKEGQFQYRMVNWAEYNRIRTEQDRREYNRQAQAIHRAAKKKSLPTPGEERYCKARTEAEAEAVLEAHEYPKPPKVYCEHGTEEGRFCVECAEVGKVMT